MSTATASPVAQFTTAREHAIHLATRARAAKPAVRYAIAEASGSLLCGYYVGGYVEKESRFVPVAYIVSGSEAYGMNLELMVDGEPASSSAKWEELDAPTPTALEVEVAFRLRTGWTQVTVKEFTARYEALGYRLDRSHDCRCVARYLSDGRTYPCCTAYPVNITNGRSAWNEDKGRADFAGLQRLRGEIFAVSRGAILEV